MRPKESRPGCAGDRDGPGPGEPPAVTPALPLAASHAPEPPAEPEPSPAQAPAAGQEAGSGSPSASGPPTRTRPASEAGSEPRAQCAPHSRLSRRNAQPVRCNSDAPWTRFIVQGPFGPRATGLGTGEAAGIWKTPTAYIGRRQGVSGPEFAAFSPELEEGKPGPGTPERGGLEQLQAGGAPVRSRRPAPSGTQPHPPSTMRCRYLQGLSSPVATSPPPPLLSP